MNHSPLPHPNQARPAASYDEAVARIARLQARRTAGPLNPLSQTIGLTHGTQTVHAFVLYHGYTNSPHQFRLLGEQLHARGHSVLIPRMPHHGLAERRNRDLERLTSSELLAFADETLDIALGLGRAVTVLGLSAGGVLAAWLAATRAEVAQAAVLSAAFGAAGVPDRLLPLFNRLLHTLPNRYIEWNRAPAHTNGSEERQLHAYPRWSTRGLAAVLTVGRMVERLARRQPLLARDVIVIDNDNDGAISLRKNAQIVALWQRRGGAVRTFRFAKHHRLDHDYIDPDHPKANVALVYPILFDALGA